MKLTITTEAVAKLHTHNQNKNSYLLLWYDIEDCGCGVNGVPTIRLVNKIEKYYLEIENEQWRTFIAEQQTTFFAPTMKLSVVDGMFRLSSPNEMLNPFIAPSSLYDPMDEKE